MKQVILFLLFFVQVAVFGQKQVKNANKAFQKESYVAASKIYEDAVNSGDVTPELLRNLGDSYYYNARYAEAAPWYAKLFQLSSDQTAEYYFRYAQALKSAQLQMRSDSVMAVYCSKFPTEIRAKNYLVKQRYFFENNPFLAIHLKNLEINTVYSDYGATIHGDSIYFASARPEILDPEEYERTQQPYTNLFVAKFIDTTVSRSKIYDNGKTFSVFHEATPTFSTDGKTMYYTKNELASKKNKTLVNGRYRIYKSIYENGKWIDKGVVNIKTNDSCRIAHPALSPDNKRLYFSSDMKGTYGQSDIFYVDLYDNDSVSLPVNLGVKVNTEGRDSYPFVSQDNQLFFASEGHPGMGGFDVFVIDLNATGTTPKNLAAPINSVDDDFAFVWKKDLYKAVLTSNRLGGKGDDDIYAFALPKPIEQVVPAPTAPVAIVAMGKVTDSKTGAVLANSIVTVTDATGKVVATVSTDAEGNYNFPIVAGQLYQLAYVSNGYESAQQTLTIPSTQITNSSVDQQLTPVLPVIEPVTPVVPAPTEPIAIVAMGKVTDSKTGAVLANSIVTVTDATGKVVATVSTDAEGNYNFPIVAGQSYQLAYVANGYESAQQTLTIPGTQITNSSVDEQLTQVPPVIEPVTPVVPAPTEPIAIGTDLAKVFAINPIYFDVNKAIIRPDAALELDKIVAFMNEHPELEIELGSHTDCRSSASYNKSLSDRRAKASAAYIKARIKHPERIKGKGYGESQLLNNCFCEDTIKSTCSEEEHQLNRRTEFKVVGIKTKQQPISESGGYNNPIVEQTKPNQTSGATKPLSTVAPATNQEVVTQSENVKTPPVSFELGTDLAKLYAINPIYFDVNRAIIRPDAALELDKIAAIMNEHPELEIELGSHTDCRSTASYNQSLSNRRAKASAAYVKARIKHPERIKGKGYGESQLLNNCFCEDTIESTCSDEEHQLNRRTEFKIVGLNGEKKGKNAPVDTTTNATTLVKLPKVVKKPIKTNARLKDSIPTVYPAGFEVGADLTKLLQINMIYFDLDKYNIRPEAALELDKIVAVMKQYPNMKIELTSHTDCRMPTDYNQRLSNNRARTSKSYLVAHGIKSARIVGKGLGETQLVVNCPCEGEESSLCTEEQHQLNRRTEFIILSL
jgi:outer membrane protein OmpA-like peptidoglycan-associated protein/tetratricopeptide (TPR) repeat protein